MVTVGLSLGMRDIKNDEFGTIGSRCVIVVEHVTWAFGSKDVLIRSSPSLQQHQKAMHAIVNTAMSKALV